MERILSEAHTAGKRIRVVGNALSPNGLGLSEDTMLSLGQCDRVLHVDEKQGTVTVEVRMAWRRCCRFVEERMLLAFSNYSCFTVVRLCPRC